MSELRLYAVLYIRSDGVVTVEDSGLCLSTAAARSRSCSEALCSEAKWDEMDQAWVSKVGTRLAIRPVTFRWEEVRDAR